MTHSSIKDLLETLNHMGETSKIEAKEGREVGRSILETICAYANEPNQNGGYILLGIAKGDNDQLPFYKIIGVANPEKLKDDITSQCASSFNTVIRPNISEEMVEEKCVLKIFIPEAQPKEKPVYLKSIGLPKGAFRRIGAADVRCTDEDLQVLYEAHSHNLFEQQIAGNSTLDDLDPDAIIIYRQLRAKVSPTAKELSWSDEDLLKSLNCLTEHPKSGLWVPTIAGLLIFGKTDALRKIFPLLRVDYIRVPSKAWIDDPDNRFITVEIRDSLLKAVRRAEAAILDDLPKAFSLPEGELQREDLPLIPARVIREALVNALMHRNYRHHRTIQIIRYSNRLEFENPGYSLASEDKLGHPGSYSRNPTIATIFHDLNLAETKGSGIRTMMQLMEKHGLTAPTFHSDRVSDTFSVQLLFHHFLSEEDIKWLAQFKAYNLNDGQKKALIYIRETGAIDNTAYRYLNKVEILEASQQLKDLRKKELIKQEAKGSATYYTVGLSVQNLNGAKINRPMQDENRHMLEDNRHMPNENRHMLEVPEAITLLISKLGKKPRIAESKKVVLALCSWREMGAEEIASYLKRKDPRRLVRDVIKFMIEEHLLELTIPQSRKHPYQKYRTIKKEKREQTIVSKI